MFFEIQDLLHKLWVGFAFEKRIYINCIVSLERQLTQSIRLFLSAYFWSWVTVDNFYG